MVVSLLSFLIRYYIFLQNAFGLNTFLGLINFYNKLKPDATSNQLAQPIGLISEVEAGHLKFPPILFYWNSSLSIDSLLASLTGQGFYKKLTRWR